MLFSLYVYTLNAGLFLFSNGVLSLLGHFIGLLLMFLPRCWVIFKAGLYFLLPN